MLKVNKVKFATTIGMFLIMVAFIALPAFTPMPALADDVLDVGLTEVGGATGLGQQDLKATVGSIIKAALGFLGVVAIVIVLIGGFKYMVAGGSDEKVGDAKKWIISGIIGLAIILSAYAITSFVVDSLLTATTGDGAPVSE